MTSTSVERALDGVRSLVAPDRTRPAVGIETAAVEIIFEPANIAELAELVRKCEADRIPLAPLGAGRTLSQIRRVPVPLGVSLARMNRIVAYEPDDMTIVLEAGTSLGEIERLTAPRRQRLAIDPHDPRVTSIGAAIGAAHAGPLRLSEGTVRDLLIGIQFVGHDGRIVRAGGRVVKNVAGYDLMKVMTGSFGTLGIVTEATFKVRPVAEGYAIAAASFERATEAFDAARRLRDALSLAHLEVLSRAIAAAIGGVAKPTVFAGISGSPLEVQHQKSLIARTLSEPVEFLDDASAIAGYQRLRDARLERATLSARLAVTAAELPAAIAACDAEFVAHAGSGVAELYLARDLDASTAARTVTAWRDAAHRARGNLRLLAAAPEIRKAVDFFDRPPDGALGLMRRLKQAFDPAAVFNPGCFVAGL
ncbi:MAG: FAD-binding oxidoreductase [Candidatus Binataceae bacterium]